MGLEAEAECAPPDPAGPAGADGDDEPHEPPASGLRGATESEPVVSATPSREPGAQRALQQQPPRLCSDGGTALLLARAQSPGAGDGWLLVGAGRGGVGGAGAVLSLACSARRGLQALGAVPRQGCWSGQRPEPQQQLPCTAAPSRQVADAERDVGLGRAGRLPGAADAV